MPQHSFAVADNVQMQSSRRIIWYGAIAAALLGLITVIYDLSSAWFADRPDIRPTPIATILYLLLWVVPSCLLAVGAFAYAVNRKPWGLWLLIASAIVTDVVVVASFVGVVWLNPPWIVLLVILQFVITTVVLSLALFGTREQSASR